MNTISAVAELHLRELRIIRAGRATVPLYKTSPCHSYVTRIKALQFSEDFPALPMEDFQNHHILVFELTSLQDAA